VKHAGLPDGSVPFGPMVAFSPAWPAVGGRARRALVPGAGAVVSLPFPSPGLLPACLMVDPVNSRKIRFFP
jgi:hypothetical protein